MKSHNLCWRKKISRDSPVWSSEKNSGCITRLSLGRQHSPSLYIGHHNNSSIGLIQNLQDFLSYKSKHTAQEAKSASAQLELL